jgi:hypothetical protein
VRIYKRTDNPEQHRAERRLNDRPLPERESYRETVILHVEPNEKEPRLSRYTFRFFCEARRRVVIETHTFAKAKERGLL